LKCQFCWLTWRWREKDFFMVPIISQLWAASTQQLFSNLLPDLCVGLETCFIEINFFRFVLKQFWVWTWLQANKKRGIDLCGLRLMINNEMWMKQMKNLWFLGEFLVESQTKMSLRVHDSELLLFSLFLTVYFWKTCFLLNKSR
jgi:hypothetical protein